MVLIALVLTGPLATAIGDEIGLGDTALTIWSIAKWPLLFVVVVLVIGLLYRFSPNAQHEGLRWILPGSLVATVLWLVASAGFSLYVANFGSYSGTYGSLAGGDRAPALALAHQRRGRLRRPVRGRARAHRERRPRADAARRAGRRSTPATATRSRTTRPPLAAPEPAGAGPSEPAAGRDSSCMSHPERIAPSGPLSKLRSMSGQGQIEALAGAAGAPLRRRSR